MASENETVADIVAEFREMVHQSVDGIIAVKADVIADRIEAAWKREKETWETLHEVAVQMLGQTRAEADRRVEEVVKPGNAAAMREALKSIYDYAVAALDKMMTDGVQKWLIHKTKAAISAPPRNCDRFNSLYDAVVAWGREDQGWNDWPDDDSEDENDLINILTGDQEHELIDWLFAPSAERKGEGDGR